MNGTPADYTREVMTEAVHNKDRPGSYPDSRSRHAEQSADVRQCPRESVMTLLIRFAGDQKRSPRKTRKSLKKGLFRKSLGLPARFTIAIREPVRPV